MIDKINLVTPREIDPEEACQHLEGQFTKVVTTATKYHNRVFVFKTGPHSNLEHLVSLHSGPRHPSISQSKIEVNPSRFLSFDKLTEMLTALLSRVDDLKVTRLDSAVDVQMPVSRIYQSLVITRKKHREVYKLGHEVTGFYVGAFPEVISVYDKALESKVEGPLSRIEVRQSKGKVPVGSYWDLPFLREYRPFSRMKFVKLASRPLTNLRDINKVRLLEESIAHLGSQGTAKTFNQHGNFLRNFGSLIESEPELSGLDSIYQSNLNKYFQQGD